MIALCILAGRRIGIGPAPEMIYLARQHVGAVVVNRNGLVSTSERYVPPANTYSVRVPALLSLETVHCREWN